jgi:hypothetical protein
MNWSYWLHHPSRGRLQGIGVAMTEREALKLALEALEFMSHVDSIFAGEFDFQINAIKKALAQPEPWEKFCDSNCVWTDHHPDCKLAQPEPNYKKALEVWLDKTKWVQETVKPNELGMHRADVLKQRIEEASPQRTWVGLTDEEMQTLWGRYAHMEMMRAIEAKLKEKNNG